MRIRQRVHIRLKWETCFPQKMETRMQYNYDDVVHFMLPHPSVLIIGDEKSDVQSGQLITHYRHLVIDRSLLADELSWMSVSLSMT
ncbi:hypothetical protein RB195_012487 [Necator americanus]|uniref:Uncharacterized protein n=1 Tax=Necator americanus TaxID=51031 RepID=A0ABR1D8T8_NECAM